MTKNEAVKALKSKKTPQAAPQKPAKQKKLLIEPELRSRITSASLLASIVMIVTLVGGGLFSLFWVIASVIIAIEFLTMARVQPYVPLCGLLSCFLVLIGFVFYLYQDPLLVIGLLALAVSGIILVGQRFVDKIWAVAGLFCALVITLVPVLVRDIAQHGLVLILWMYWVVWVTDIAAYFAGKTFGGAKLFPSISPKKTWSGFIGGLVAGTLVATLMTLLVTHVLNAPPIKLEVIIILSLLASFVSQSGDLAESGLKRMFQVKDAGQWIPGHGGAMDRLDGFWAVSALMGLILLVQALLQP